MKYLVITFLVNLFSILPGSFYILAQDNDEDDFYDSVISSTGNIYTDTIKSNNSSVTRYRTVYTNTKDSINVYKVQKRFAYVSYLDSVLRQNKIPVETVSSESLRELNKGKHSSPQSLRANSKQSGNLFSNLLVRIILWILAFGFIAYILFRLFLTGGIFRKDSLRRNINPAETPEENNIESTGYDRLIKEAIIRKDFRLAIRYLYLQTLQKLFTAGLLQFSADKTNYQYITELRNHPVQNEFSLLTINYEYVWYGKFDISEERYTEIHKQFKKYHQKI